MSWYVKKNYSYALNVKKEEPKSYESSKVETSPNSINISNLENNYDIFLKNELSKFREELVNEIIKFREELKNEIFEFKNELVKFKEQINTLSELLNKDNNEILYCRELKDNLKELSEIMIRNVESMNEKTCNESVCNLQNLDLQIEDINNIHSC